MSCGHSCNSLFSNMLQLYDRRSIFRAKAARISCVALLLACIFPFSESTSAQTVSLAGAPEPLHPLTSVDWPAGTQILEIENLDGLILLSADLRGAEVDTTVLLALDSGAGSLALDRPLARALGLLSGNRPQPGVGFAQQALPRLTIGTLQIDQVAPLLTIDGEIVRRVTDRPVSGLLGQRPLTGRAVVVDYREEIMAIVPVPQGRERSTEASREALGSAFSALARPIPFNLAKDGKILVRAAIADPTTDSLSAMLNWIIDTGATRSVLFEESVVDTLRHLSEWHAMEGLTAPTLFGDVQARIVRIPLMSIQAPDSAVCERDLETVVIASPLAAMLSSVVGRQVHGLIGYSFLKNFRIGIDYANRVLWLDRLPEGWEGRPYRDSQIGLQLERREGELRIVGVVRGSPADAAGMKPGDDLIMLDGSPATSLDVDRATRRMEGPPGSTITLTTIRAGELKTYKMFRRKLF
jgi:membrane-associated protease RseP (regulator of RpoE activity)